ncbi:Obp56h.2 family protein [Megaselia abdita]
MNSTLLFFLFALVALSSAANVDVNVVQNQYCIQNGLKEDELRAFFNEGRQYCTGAENAELLAESVICQVVAILETLGIFDGKDTTELAAIVNEAVKTNPELSGLLPGNLGI